MAREKRRARSHFRRDHRGQSIFLVALAAIIVALHSGPSGYGAGSSAMPSPP